jgi:hypothetical protein
MSQISGSPEHRLRRINDGLASKYLGIVAVEYQGEETELVRMLGQHHAPVVNRLAEDGRLRLAFVENCTVMLAGSQFLNANSDFRHCFEYVSGN